MHLSAGFKNRREKTAAAIGLNVLAMAVLVLIMRPSFETNDDIVFAEFGSGLRGVKTPHLIFQNCFLGIIYRILYEITGRLPWYTIVQYAVLLAAFSAVTYVLINRLEGYSGLYLSVVLLCVFGYEGYIHIQFTKTAGIAAAAAVFLLFHVITSEKFCIWEFLVGILLGIFGFMYREDQFFASSALMAGIGVYFLLTLKKYFPEKTGKRLGICVGTFGCLLLAVFAADRADAFMYRSPQWQEYQEFNRMRSRLLDYGFPDYDTNRTLYKELGISEEALQLYKTWNFNDPEKFTAEVMEKLVEQKPERNVSGSQMLHFIKRFPGDAGKLTAAYVALLIFILWLIFGKKNAAGIVSLLTEIFILAGVYFYLYFQGRYMVNRVDVGLWFSVCLTMLWIFGESLRSRRGIADSAGVILCIIGILASQSFWHTDYRIATTEIPKARISQRAVLETIGTDKDHVYLAKSGTVSEIVCYGPFDRMPENLLDNLYWFGGWECRTPGFIKEMKEHGIVNPYKDMIGNENVYLIDDNIDLTVEYIRQNYDAHAEAVFVRTLGNVDLYQIK